MAHTLTFSGDLTVSVDGQSVTSPYTLAKSCTLRFESTNESFGLKVNDGAYYKGTTTIDLADTDIMVNTSVPALTGGSSVIVIVNYTESVTRVSVDLTTLSGWENLSAGTHAITVKAKADGCKDSEASAAVSVEKAGTAYNVSVIVQVENFTDFGNYFRIYDGDDTGNIVKEWTTQPTWGETAEVTITTGKLTFKMSGNTSAHSLRATTSDSGITIGKTVNLNDIVHTPSFFGAKLECIINSTGGIIVSANYNTSD